MAGLNQPPMDGSAGALQRCCKGANKNKLYDPSNACPDNLSLVITESECECVECTKSEQCQFKGYSSCYVCENGECVKGPFCCSNTPGSKYAPCNVDPAQVNPDTSCCVNFIRVSAWQAPPSKSVYETSEGRCKVDVSEKGVFFTAKADCEEFEVEDYTVKAEAPGDNKCGCPKGKYTYKVQRLWKKSPSGSRRPARNWCSYGAYSLTRALEEKYGPRRGYTGGGGCWWHRCSPISWYVGTTSSGWACTKDQSSFQNAGEESYCLGSQWPENDACACSGQAYANAELNDSWTGWCGICAGKISWNDCSW